jgi:multidrug efflux pump subunit AcrA (membrane-fusion protein)
LAALVLVAGGGGFALWTLRGGGPPQQQGMQGQALPVELEQLELGTIEESSDFLGVLDAPQGIVLRPEIEGRVTQIFVSSGDGVAAGDPIVELSPMRSQAELNAAEASVSAARAALTTAAAQRRSAEAERERARADLDLQRQEIDRTQFLVAEGAQSQQQLDLAERNLETAQSAFNAAAEQVQAAISAEQEAQAALTRSQAQAEVAQTNLGDTLISAPIEGTVGDIPVKLGDFVNVGDTLTTITQNQTLELNLSVPVEQRERLRRGLTVELQQTGAAEPLATGQISFVAPQVEANTQSVLAKARFPNPRGLLQDDQRVEATVIWQTRPGVLVPTAAISRLGNQAFVFVAAPPEEDGRDADGNANGEANGEAGGNAGNADGGASGGGAPSLIAKQRAVQLGDIQGDRYQVLEGLEPGETIVVSGILNLTDGVPIQPASEAGPPPGAGGPPQ